MQSCSLPKRLALPPQPPYQKRSQDPVSRRWYHITENRAQALPGSLSRVHGPGTAAALRPLPGPVGAVGIPVGTPGVLGRGIRANTPQYVLGDGGPPLWEEEVQPPPSPPTRITGHRGMHKQGMVPVPLTHCAGVPGGGLPVLVPAEGIFWGHPGVPGCWLLSAAEQKR